jgi:replicative DNA helicase
MLGDKLGNNIENVGGFDYIIKIACSCPTTENFEHYQNIVLEEYKLRMIGRAASQFLNEKNIRTC